MNARSSLIVLALALGLVAATLFLWVGSGDGARGAAAGASPTVAPGSGGAAAPGRPPAAGPLSPPPTIAQPAGGSERTTVLWPVRLELSLVRALHLPDEDGVPPIGSGSSARLAGRIADASGDGVRAELSFLAGPNTGRVLHTDSEGRFGASDLLPGLSVVDVRGGGILGSRREVRLRQGRETLLNIGYGRPGAVFGRVLDREDQGIPGASVVVDGTRVVTDANGDFQVPSVAGGAVVVEVSKPGYALYQEVANVTGGGVLPRERLTVVLQPQASLAISVANDVGGPGPAQVVLLPGDFDRTAGAGRPNVRFPWELGRPIEVFPGTPRTVDGLPPEVVRVLAFRPGALGKPQVANLRAGQVTPLELHLEPVPRVQGVVRFEGDTVPGARVRLEAPNQVRATLAFLREPSYFLETGVLPALPPAVQEVETDGSGRFSLSAWSDVAPVRYLEVRGPAGTWAGRLVRAGESELEVELQRRRLGDGELLVDFPGRFQALPVEVVVNGSPLDPSKLPAGEALSVESLLEGTWRLEASWYGEPLLQQEALRIDGRTRLSVELPPGAIEGQDEETWTRAGREFPP